MNKLQSTREHQKMCKHILGINRVRLNSNLAQFRLELFVLRLNHFGHESVLAWIGLIGFQVDLDLVWLILTFELKLS